MVTVEARYWIDPKGIIPAGLNTLEREDALLVSDWDGALTVTVKVADEGINLTGAMRKALCLIGLVLEEYVSGGQQAVPHQVVLLDVEAAMKPREVVNA